MSEVTWRPAVKGDRPLLEGFTCTQPDGPDFERLVQRYFRVQAISHTGSPDGLKHDQRLLLLFQDDEHVAAAVHRRGATPAVRNFVFAAVQLDHQGSVLSNGERSSQAVWSVVVNDIMERDRGTSETLVARVHPENVRSLALCRRNGLLPGEPDDRGLIVCAGPLPRP